jgi:CheY-like chemotaxis protein
MIQKLGCSLEIVENGKEALKALCEKKFDLVLMDCQMPEMDGYSATRIIRERERRGQFGDTPVRIVALTAHAMKGDREQCLAAGMDDYLRKPFTLDQLYQILTRWLCHEHHAERPAHARIASDTSAEAGVPGDSNVQAEAAALRRSQCLDRNVLDSIRSLDTGNAPGVLARVIGIYMQQSPLLMQKLRDAVSTQDLAAIEATAHSLKSGNANVGALEMAALCSELELLGRAKRLDSTSEILARVEEAYPFVLDALKAELHA